MTPDFANEAVRHIVLLIFTSILPIIGIYFMIHFVRKFTGI